ncbi:MAG: sigma-70 family RNA polymerase sigma factor [Thermoguttaceae bacterium]
MDRVELERLFCDLAPGLLLFAKQWGVCDAEDIVQDAMAKLAQQNIPPNFPKAWLYRAVRNAIIDRSRRAKLAVKIETTESWFDSVPEEQQRTPPFDDIELTAALAQLEATQREIVVAKIWGDMTFREIAELLGRPNSSIHDDYKSAIKKLKQILTNE